jgi:drug/metabolite transporter (DMT)-like permease
VWTAISFVAFFLGVGVHSAAVVFTLEASFAPLAVTAWAVIRAHRGDEQARPGAAQRRAACMLAVLGTSLVVVMAQADSGGMISFLAAALLGVIAGVAAGGVIIVSRGLGRAGVSVGHVMAHRFYATVVFAAIVLLTLVPYGLLAPPSLSVGLIGAAALSCVVVPLFLLQYAMQQLSPVSVTAALATMPAITIAIELASGRPVSWMVLFLGVLIVPANLVLLVTQRPELTFARRFLYPTTILDAEQRAQAAVATV